MRDLLLIADESGSIGWINFEKIKINFKVVFYQVRLSEFCWIFIFANYVSLLFHKKTVAFS